MKVNEEFAKFLVGFVHAIKAENLKWEKENLPVIQEIQREKQIFKQNIEQELKKREIEFKFEIEQMEKEGASKIQDFQDFLDAIDQIKNDCKKHFEKMTLPINLSIHQYGKQLLISMWNSKTLHERKRYEQQLLDFLYTVNEDICLVSSENNQGNYYLPEKTIQLMRQN